MYRATFLRAVLAVCIVMTAATSARGGNVAPASIISDTLALPENAPRVESIAALRARPVTTLDRGAIISLLGYNAPNDGGGGIFRWTATSTATDDAGITINPTGNTTGRWVRDLDGLPYVSSQMFGGMCDSTFADTSTAYTKAAVAAAAYSKVLHIGGGIGVCVVDGPITLPSQAINIEGDGPNNSAISLQYNGPAFIWGTSGGHQILNFDVGNFTVSGFFPGAYNLSRIFLINGDGSLIQFGDFHDIHALGIYSPWEIDTPSVNWTRWNRISVVSGQQDSINGIVFDKGSGTGNTFLDWKTLINSTIGHVFSFNGAGYGVGDIIISGHFGGINPGTGSKFIGIGAGTIYRENIDVTGAQIDGGLTIPFDFDTTSPAQYSRLTFSNNNVGGNTVLTLPPITHSVIHDNQSSDWRAGNDKTLTSSGTQTTPLFNVILADYNAVDCHVVLSGIVQGVARGGSMEEVLLYSQGGGASIKFTNNGQISSNLAPGFYSINFATSGQVVTVGATSSPTASGSTLTADIACFGGNFTIARQ